jgi:lysophospholipase L1-like esterase
MKTIGLFGDSILKGVVLDSLRGRYILLKDSFVNLVGRNLDIALNSYAKFGCTISAGKKIIEKHINEISGYACTVLEFGGNDCDFDWAAVSRQPEEMHLPNTPLAEFEDLYSEVIDQVADCGSLPILLSLPPLDAKRYFAWIARGLNAENIRRWLGDVEHIYRWHEMYNLAVVRLAAKKQVPLIDIRRAFLETRDYFSLFCEDGIHPNEAGHLLISDTIKSFAAEANPVSVVFSV